MSIRSFFDTLNPEQAQAATIDAQNVLVLAGAGCGKTKTIVARAAYLIDQGVAAQQIQIVTFTRRAASEIVSRVEHVLGASAQGIHASTFHTFCMGILRRYARAFDLDAFSVIDRDDQIMMLKLLRGQRSEQRDLPKAAQLLDLYSYIRNTLCSFDVGFEKLCPEMQQHKVCIIELLKNYEQQKRQRNYLDYDDILDYVAKYLQHSPDLVEHIAARYRYLLVDEMQDTNPLQWMLLQPFIGRSQLFCVGDDAQSIYGFRGADFENIHRFKARVPDACVLTLARNYRSTQSILDLSNWLLQRSPLAYNKPLQAVRGNGSLPVLHTFANEFDEARWIANDLQQRHGQGEQWGSHMILVRSTFSGRQIESALIAADIPYQFIGGIKLLESAHVKDVLSVLRVVANFKDELAWIRFLTLWDGIGDVGAARLVKQLIEQNDLEQIAALCLAHSKLPHEVAHTLKRIHGHQQFVTQCIEDAVLLLSAQLAKKYKNQDWSKRQRDFSLVQQLGERHSSIGEFIEAYLLDPISHSEIERQPQQDIVTLITIHSAKGTECEVCYIAQASAGAFPHLRAQGKFDDVEEERRVLYVAMTRAKDELILTRQTLTTWCKDQVDQQGRLIESYFLDSIPNQYCRQQFHCRQPFWQNPTLQQSIQPQGARPHIGIDWEQ